MFWIVILLAMFLWCFLDTVTQTHLHFQRKLQSKEFHQQYVTPHQKFYKTMYLLMNLVQNGLIFLQRGASLCFLPDGKYGWLQPYEITWNLSHTSTHLCGQITAVDQAQSPLRPKATGINEIQATSLKRSRISYLSFSEECWNGLVCWLGGLVITLWWVGFVSEVLPVLLERCKSSVAAFVFPYNYFDARQIWNEYVGPCGS